jgi:hypothetical protein
MDGSRFDTLTKTLAAAGSRRQALGGLLAASLALLGGTPTEETAAHDARKKCKKKEGDAKKKCLKKAKKHNASHTTPLPTGGTVVIPPAPIPATCRDGIQNGSESDVDCGGPDCPRCRIGQRCNSRADCATAFCLNNVCTACTASTTSAGTQCGAGCSCPDGSCHINPAPFQRTVCADCPAYSYCQAVSPQDPAGAVYCFPPCG